MQKFVTEEVSITQIKATLITTATTATATATATVACGLFSFRFFFSIYLFAVYSVLMNKYLSTLLFFFNFSMKERDVK